MNNTNQISNSIESSIQDSVALLSRAEACKFLRVSQSMLDSHLSIPKVRIGRKVFYSKATLISFIKEAESNAR